MNGSCACVVHQFVGNPFIGISICICKIPKMFLELARVSTIVFWIPQLRARPHNGQEGPSISSEHSAWRMPSA